MFDDVFKEVEVAKTSKGLKFLLTWRVLVFVILAFGTYVMMEIKSNQEDNHRVLLAIEQNQDSTKLFDREIRWKLNSIEKNQNKQSELNDQFVAKLENLNDQSNKNTTAITFQNQTIEICCGFRRK